MTKWLVQHVKKSHSIFDTTLKYRQWFSSLKQSSTHSQNWVHCEQNIIPSHTCSMSEMTCRTRQERSLYSWSNARLSTMIQFSERIIQKRAKLRALWAKHHCISYLFDVEMGRQTRQDNSVAFRYNSLKNFSEILHDSLRYQRFTIPPHTHTSHHDSIEPSLPVRLSKKSTTVSLSIPNLNSGIWQK